MTLMLAKNGRFNVSETEVTWSRDRGTITFSRLIYSTVAHFSMKCDAEQLADRLEKASKMSDGDFKYIHDLNNESEGK